MIRLQRSGFYPRQEQRIFPLSSISRPALGPTQPPVQWVPGVLSPGVKRGRGVMLTTHPHLVPRSRMSRSYNSSPPSACMACRGTALLYLLYRLHKGWKFLELNVHNYRQKSLRRKVGKNVKCFSKLKSLVTGTRTDNFWCKCQQNI
jgi:hypothetical protein